jgi:hypothetical protein
MWRKSSRSSGGGNACVEVAAAPDTAPWRKSSYSSGGGNNCVEVAPHRSSIAIRDSKNPDGPALLLDLGAFRSLTARIKNGDRRN